MNILKRTTEMEKFLSICKEIEVSTTYYIYQLNLTIKISESKFSTFPIPTTIKAGQVYNFCKGKSEELLRKERGNMKDDFKLLDMKKEICGFESFYVLRYSCDIISALKTGGVLHWGSVSIGRDVMTDNNFTINTRPAPTILTFDAAIPGGEEIIHTLTGTLSNRG